MAAIPAGAHESHRDPGDDRERRLHEVIAGYLEDLEAGRRPDAAAMTADHPDLADELASFFANRERLERLTAPWRDGRATVETPAVLPFPAGGSRAVDRPDAAPGGRIGHFGEYELLEVIAEGGMGVVFVALHLRLGKRMALKMIRSGRFATTDDVQRFRLEAEAAAHLEHPNIVPIYDVGEHEGQHYYTMRFVEGGSLAAQAGRFIEQPRLAAAMVATVARAVHYAHERGILHRDLKPANILLFALPGEPPESWRPLVADFGLAKWFEGHPAAGLTRSGSIVGTPGYMAPEQADGAREAITTAVDIHALGAILYELLSGRPPFRAASVLETLRLVREEEPAPLRPLNPLVDRDLETIVLKCLAKAPSRRYASAAALADDVDRWQAGRPIRARPVGIPERVVKWVRRRQTPAALLIVGVAALSASVLAIAGLVAWNSESTRRRQAEGRLVGTIEQQTQMREDDYFQRILAAEQALFVHDPDRAARLLEACPAELRGWEWRHLVRRLHPEWIVLHGHTAFLCSTDFRPSPVEVSCRGDVIPGPLWGLANESAAATPSGQEPSPTRASHRVFGPDGTAYGLCFDRSGTRLATAGAEGIVKVWNVVEGRMTHLIRAHRDWAAGVAFSSDGRRLATSGQDGIVRIWDIGPDGGEGGRELHVLTGHDGPVFGVSFSPDGRRVASAGSDGTVRVWEPAAAGSGSIAVLRGHEGEVMALAFHPDGRRIASGGADRRVRIWDSSDGRELASFRADTAQRINAVAYSPDGTRLAVGSHDRSVAIWDALSPRRLIDYPGHSGPVLYVGFSPGGEILASASQDATIKLWDPEEEPGMRSFGVEPSKMGGPRPARSPRWYGGPAFAPIEGEVAAAGSEGAVATWDGGGRVKRFYRGGPGPMIAMAYSPDGHKLAAVGTDRTVRLWDLRTNRDPITLADPQEGFSSLAYRPDGHMLATGGGDPPKVIQVPEGKWLRPDGEGRTIRLWDPSTGREVRSLEGHVGSVHALAFDPGGERLASAGADRIIRLWDPDSGRVASTLEGHSGAVFALAFSPDGALLASAGFDREIRIWDVASGRTIRTLSGHTNWVLGLAFSPDGSRLASAGADQTVRLWDAASGREVLALRGARDRVHGVAFSPDGGRLAAASADGSVRVWEAGVAVRPG
jgi:WD40 repeat protein/tRNA A-37 threonylcarbamoyl transferase component Bud32